MIQKINETTVVKTKISTGLEDVLIKMPFIEKLTEGKYIILGIVLVYQETETDNTEYKNKKYQIVYKDAFGVIDMVSLNRLAQPIFTKVDKVNNKVTSPIPLDTDLIYLIKILSVTNGNLEDIKNISDNLRGKQFEISKSKEITTFIPTNFKKDEFNKWTYAIKEEKRSTIIFKLLDEPAKENIKDLEKLFNDFIEKINKD